MIWIVVAAILLLFFLSTGNKESKSGKRSKTSVSHAPVTKMNIMTPHELALFKKLKEVLPSHNICPQVSFGALLSSTSMATRGTFMQKRADYVILDQEGNVAAVCELDDPSHRNRKQKDAQRDAMLKSAGYAVIRFPKQPTIEQVRRETQFITNAGVVVQENLAEHIHAEL